MKIQFKPGDTLQWAGTLSLFGVTDFTGYTLQCQFRKRSETATPGVPDEVLLAQANVSWQGSLVTPTPAFLIEVDETVTKDWPVNATLYVDVALIDPSDNIATTETAEFQTVPRITIIT